MKSHVRFELIGKIPVDQECNYPTFAIIPEMADGTLIAISIEVEHDEDKSLTYIVQRARSALQPFCTLISIGRGIEPILGATTVSVDERSVHLSFADSKLRVGIARRLKTLPPEKLLTTLRSDRRLARQVDFLYSAEAAAKTDFVSRIRYAYMVLEQEQRKGRKKGIKYTPLDDFSHLRDAISHPEVGDRDVRKFLQANIGSEQLDLHNQEHVRFLEDWSWRLLEEARRIVEKNLASLGTLFWC